MTPIDIAERLQPLQVPSLPPEQRRRRQAASGASWRRVASAVLGLALGAALSGPALARDPAAVQPSPGVSQPSQPAPSLRPVKPSDMRAGSLLLRTNDGAMVEAPRLGTDFDITVSGPTVRARVTQMFNNPGAGHVEAVYVYPLPEGAAVDSLKMIIGDRVVIGDIKERKAAKVIYEAAKARGQKAALVEQERPNIFTNSVANIGPGETVVVQIEYQEPVRRSGSEFSLRLPLVVAPRFNPKPLVQTVDLGAGGWGRVVNDPVPDRGRIVPPYLDPRKAPPTNPVTIAVRLAAGFELGEVKSLYHPVKVETPDASTRLLTLAAGAEPANRDFVLNWHAAPSKAPAVGLFRETVAGADYVLAFITPPMPAKDQAGAEAAPFPPREMILVIDNSGSMGGTSIAQAKASLGFALARLKPTDRFNVIRFNHTTSTLFGSPAAATAANIQQALGWVGGLKAEGGTNMLPALEAALQDAADADSAHLRQVVFLTDGAIGNEQQLLDTIGARRGRSRIFTVGIGSAPNSYLMTRAAELGRGTFTHIGAVGEVEARMRALFEKLEAPVVTGLSATFRDNTADVTPGLLPDLYRGEPLVLAAKLGRSSGTLEIKGRIGDQPWQVTLPLDKAAAGQGLSKMWARRKIADAEVERTLRRATPEETDKRILALALEHHLVSRLTSLVAVDHVISREPGQPLARADIPLNLPVGWDFDLVFGTGRGTPAPVDIRADRNNGRPLERADDKTRPEPKRMAHLQLHGVAKPMSGGIHQLNMKSVNLPQTATDAEIRLQAGLGLLIAAWLLVVLARRRRVGHA